MIPMSLVHAKRLNLYCLLNSPQKIEFYYAVCQTRLHIYNYLSKNTFQLAGIKFGLDVNMFLCKL